MTRELIPAPKGFVIERSPIDPQLDIVEYRFSISMTLKVAISLHSEADLEYRQMTLDHGVRQLARSVTDQLAYYVQ